MMTTSEKDNRGVEPRSADVPSGPGAVIPGPEATYEPQAGRPNPPAHLPTAPDSGPPNPPGSGATSSPKPTRLQLLEAVAEKTFELIDSLKGTHHGARLLGAYGSAAVCSLVEDLEGLDQDLQTTLGELALPTTETDPKFLTLAAAVRQARSFADEAARLSAEGRTPEFADLAWSMSTALDAAGLEKIRRYELPSTER